MTMVNVCPLSDLDDRKPAAFEVGDTPVVLIRDGNSVHALRDECSHAEIPLSEGELTSVGLECWLHGSCFDVVTGQPHHSPATEPVDVFATEVRDGDVYVDVSAPVNS